MSIYRGSRGRGRAGGVAPLACYGVVFSTSRVLNGYFYFVFLLVSFSCTELYLYVLCAAAIGLRRSLRFHDAPHRSGIARAD